ncbi:UDP-glycosyltransferase 75C1-like [Benincasa hispida]|uniref:UDP-glycosyltransferase 75C1-like n=1 Tax=Benincasa hispida TaxID=102211 RepID=UPI0018FFEB08|nr:UDP-glycosyltransferase 75C1-like [Benincasa hispida]
MRKHHFLIVCFPVHGHINPSLELAHRLTNLGHHVTFATTVLGSHRITINKKNKTTLLSFTTFSDGFDGEQQTNLNNKSTRTTTQFFSDLKLYGSQSLTNLIISNQSHNPFTFVIYSLLLHWVADVATNLHIPSALLFVQPATLLVLYYYYFHGYGDTIPNQKLQGLPLLTTNDMPSFLSPSSPHAFLLPLFKQQIEVLLLDQKSQPKVVLVNTFDVLEMQALEAIDGLKILGIGPLINPNFEPSLFANDDIIHDEYYIEWLNSKPNSSVVYISFGSLYVLSNTQKEEIVHALLESGYTFLWVMIGGEDDDQKQGIKECLLLEGQGKIVSWCCQIEVLKHPSLGCFITHCGWNSTLESLSFGVPMVGFPQQIDQPTNAKLVEDVWKMGVRVKANSQGIVEREEIRRCLDLVMGKSRDDEQRKEIVENAKKWKALATQAIGEDGTSCFNLKSFVANIDQISGVQINDI